MTDIDEAGLHTKWNARLIGLVAVLSLVNFVVDSAITAPLVVLPEMLDHFGTSQPAWLNATAMLAGVVWAPLLGKAADKHGKRKVLVLTLLLSCAGALLCAVAPSLWLFVPGRMLQGAALAAMFLSVAIVRSACAPRIGMIVVGIVTSGSAVLNIASRFFIEKLAKEFGFQILFLISAVVAVAMAVCVRKVVPESPVVKTPSSSRAGGGLRNLGRPLVLTLLVIFLAAGSYQSMLQLIPLIGDVSAGQDLGYGLADQGSVALLLAAPGIGVTLGGPAAGWLAARIGPAPTLAGAVALGTVGTIGMFLGASELAAALCFAFLLGITAGALGAAGFNMAISLAAAERQGIVSSLVMVMVSIGAVVLDFVGGTVLKATTVDVDGDTVNSATGVFTYIAIGTGMFAIAAVLAATLVRGTRASKTAQIGVEA
ncbi:MFS transporter [Streptomyces boninensis]|uniref:MFS transporter n=1 Tax=Streptomyces boninensis TaxID=2039455 RepID=UPI003B20C3FF